MCAGLAIGNKKEARPEDVRNHGIKVAAAERAYVIDTRSVREIFFPIFQCSRSHPKRLIEQQLKHFDRVFNKLANEANYTKMTISFLEQPVTLSHSSGLKSVPPGSRLLFHSLKPALVAGFVVRYSSTKNSPSSLVIYSYDLIGLNSAWLVVQIQGQYQSIFKVFAGLAVAARMA